jgi:hypothetical protein
MADRLNPKQSLTVNGSLSSKSGAYVFVQQADGNLVLYEGGHALWSSETYGMQIHTAIMQEDGNFVLYGATGAAWASGTDGNPGAWLVVQDDGNVVVYAKDGRPLWATNTVADTSGPITAEKAEDVGGRKRMTTKAKLYRDGRLVADIFTDCYHPTEGLRGRVLVVVLDNRSRAIWVSQEYQCTTRGGVLDPTTPSKGRDFKQEKFPDAVGRHAHALDIYQSNGPLGDARQSLLDTIKTATEIYDDLKDKIATLAAAA